MTVLAGWEHSVHSSALREHQPPRELSMQRKSLQATGPRVNALGADKAPGLGEDVLSFGPHMLNEDNDHLPQPEAKHGKELTHYLVHPYHLIKESFQIGNVAQSQITCLACVRT